MINELFKYKCFIIDNLFVVRVFRFVYGLFVCLFLIIVGLVIFFFRRYFYEYVDCGLGYLLNF